jgi:hypothetical protein
LGRAVGACDTECAAAGAAGCPRHRQSDMAKQPLVAPTTRRGKKRTMRGRPPLRPVPQASAIYGIFALPAGFILGQIVEKHPPGTKMLQMGSPTYLGWPGHDACSRGRPGRSAWGRYPRYLNSILRMI